MKINIPNYPNISKTLENRSIEIENRIDTLKRLINDLTLNERDHNLARLNINNHTDEMILLADELIEIKNAVAELSSQYFPESPFTPSKFEIDNVNYDKLFIGSNEIELND